MTSETMNSTDDDRVQNNTMRHKYRVLSDEEKELMATIKDIGAHFNDMCDQMGQSRELSIAKTKMEEAVMWSCKHITA